MANRTKGPNGRFIRTVETADRDRRCAEMRGQGLTLDQIGEIVGLSRSATHEAIDRGLRGVPTLELVAAKALALAKLDAQERHFLAVQAKTWYRVDHGRVIRDENGDPMIDPDPGMRAGLALLRIAERRARQEGTDEPTRSRVEVMTEDVFAEAINNLNRELAVLEVQERANTTGDHSEARDSPPVPGAAGSS
jgi:hypothetical protein